MLKGDLVTTPLAPLLLSLAADSATGCLHVIDSDAEEALVYFKNGNVYAVIVPGRRPQLGAKLISSGALTPEALADALEAQRTELQGWKLGELLVHLGYVDQPVVEAFVKEQVHDALWDLMRWVEGRWKFRKNERTREDVAPPMGVDGLLGALRDRGLEWESISTVVHGPTAVPVLSSRGDTEDQTILDSDAWSMLCKIDGERSLAELARDCGYTIFEAGHVLVRLVQAGLVDIEEDVTVPPSGSTHDGGYGVGALAAAFAASDSPAEADASTEPASAADAVAPPESKESIADAVAAALSGISGEVEAEGRLEVDFLQASDDDVAGDEDALSRLARLVKEVSGGKAAAPEVVAPELDQVAEEPDVVAEPVVEEPVVEEPVVAEQPVAAELASVVDALNDMPPAETSEVAVEVPSDVTVPTAQGAMIDEATAAMHRRRAQHAALADPASLTELSPVSVRRPSETFADSIARVSAALNDVLGDSPEDVMSRPDATAPPAEAAAEAVQLIDEADTAGEAEPVEHQAADEAAIDEEPASIDETAPAADEAGDEETGSTEQAADSTERKFRGRASRSRAARLKAAAAAELAAAQSLANAMQPDDELSDVPPADADAASAELEAERVEAERIEAERVEAERIEAERLEAERIEAERIEAERIEAERLEAERIEAERLEAERLAAAELAEAQRLEAQKEAERLEAERAEAERLELERQEQERAERIEAERIAAEELAEAQRLEAERLEAERLENERLELEQQEQERAERIEAERIAASELAEAQRLEAERLEAERVEAERRDAEEREALQLEAERLEAERAEAERIAAEQREYEELAARASEQHSVSAATALLAELSYVAADSPIESVRGDEHGEDYDDSSYADLPVPEPVGVASVAAEATDTAALLRELASLGGDEPPAAPPAQGAPRQVPRPVQGDKKKKRGIFGR